MTQDNPPADHVSVEEAESTSPNIEENLKSKSTWLRLVFMIVFALLANVAMFVTSIVVVLGFLWVLFTGETNQHLRRAGRGLSSYLYQIVRYLTYNTDDKPFPFGAEWPSSNEQESA